MLKKIGLIIGFVIFSIAFIISLSLSITLFNYANNPIEIKGQFDASTFFLEIVGQGAVVPVIRWILFVVFAGITIISGFCSVFILLHLVTISEKKKMRGLR